MCNTDKNEFFKHFAQLDDISMLKLYREGNQAACTALIARYATLVHYRASVFSTGGAAEFDDCKQEAYMGLLSAIRSFDENNGAGFRTYASRCIDNRLKNLVVAATTKKASFYKKSVSFDEVTEEHMGDDGSHNPEAIFIQNENYARLMNLVEQHLSQFEKDVLFLYLSGCDYLSVATKLSSSQKSVDNALQRARKKLKAVLNNL